LTYVYETVGRRIPLTYALLCTNLLFWMMPRVAPNFTLVCAIRAIISLNNTLLLGAPLISDYIKTESRGMAVATSALAVGLSQLYATQILVPLTKNMDYTESFEVCGIMMFVLTFPAIFMIREPSPKTTKEEGPNESGTPVIEHEGPSVG